MDKYVMRDGELFRDDGDGFGIVLYGTGVILRELNALQKRVEELESRPTRAQYEGQGRALTKAMGELTDLRASISEAVKEIENKMSEWDGYKRTGYMMWDALDILRKHGVVEDK